MCIIDLHTVIMWPNVRQLKTGTLEKHPNRKFRQINQMIPIVAVFCSHTNLGVAMYVPAYESVYSINSLPPIHKGIYCI